MALPRPVLILCFGTFINRAGSMMVVFLTIYLKDELGLSPVFATTAMGAYGAGAMVAAGLGGHLADRLGRRSVMAASMFGGGAILLLYGHLTSPWSIVVTSAAFALVIESYRPAAAAMIADLVETEQRTLAFGLMYVSINLGFAIAPPLGTLLISAYSFLWLFRVDALTSMIYATLIILAIPETLPALRHKRVEVGATDGDAAGVPRGRGNRDRASYTSLAEAVRHILSDRPFLCFCLATLCGSCVYMQAFTTFPLYLSELGIGSTVYGRIIAVNGIMIVLLQLPVTTIVMRRNRTNMMIVGASLIAAGFGLIGVVTSVGLLVGTIVVWTLGEMVLAPLSPAIVSDLAPIELRARYMGAFTMCFSFGMMTVPIGGIVLQRLGGGSLWGGTFVIGMLATFLYAAIRRHVDNPSTQQST